jgi:hypothetical protein
VIEMKRILLSLVVIAALLASAVPAEAAVKRVPTRFAGPVLYSIGSGTVTGFSGTLASKRSECLANRTVLAEYKDASGWRVFGFVNTTAANGAFSVSGVGPRPAKYWVGVFVRKVGNIRCGPVSREGLLS